MTDGIVITELPAKESAKLPPLSEVYTLESIESAIKKFVAKYGYQPKEINLINGYICIKVEVENAF